MHSDQKKDRRLIRSIYLQVLDLMEEREGFEPSVRSHGRLISSQVHSTTLPPLQVLTLYETKISVGRH
jgi:hypothetical protein